MQKGGLFVKNRLVHAGICPVVNGGRKASSLESLEMEEAKGEVLLEYSERKVLSPSGSAAFQYLVGI